MRRFDRYRRGLVARRRGTGEPAVAAALWAAVYAAVSVTGERLSTTVLEVQWQLLPLDVLRAHPFRSVWHLHTQPPLWNLLVGCIDRWSPLSLAVSMQLVLVASGCVLAACIAWILRALGLARTPVLVLTAIATLNGSVLFAALRPQYELPVAAMLAGLVVLAMRAPGARSGRVLVLASVVVTALVLTRSLYHPVVIPIVLGIVWWLHAGHVRRRDVIVAVAIPLVLVGGWAVKNEVLFDRPTLASWTGMNLLRSVAPALEEDDVDELRRSGAIDLPDGTFLPLADYRGVVPPCTPAHDDPALTVESRPVVTTEDDLAPVEEITNFNHECFLPVYDAARDDAVAMARAHPSRWLLARVWSLNNWFELPKPPTSSPLSTMISKLTTVALLGVAHPGLPSSWPPFWVNHWTWTLTIPLASVVLLVAAVRRGRRRRAPIDGGFVLAGFLLAWTFAAGIAFELGEQARFRAPTDPLVLAFAGALALQWVHRRRQRPAEPPPPADRPPGPRRQVALSAAVLVAGIALVNLRQGTAELQVVDAATAAAQVEQVVASAAPAPTTTVAPTTSTSSTATSAPPATTATSVTAVPAAVAPAVAPAAAPPVPARTTCRLIVHLGDSNLGMTLGLFQTAYDELGVQSILDFANGRGADIAVDGTTARQAIAAARADTSPDGRCWIIALSGADAVQAHLQGVDPAPTIRAIADALGDEPAMWIPPVLTSATTEWNLVASTTYDLALQEAVAGRANIGVFDWPSIALQHLDQFQSDGIHYTGDLYRMFVRSVLDAASARWEIGA